MAKKKKLQSGEPIAQTKEDQDKADRLKTYELWKGRATRARALRADWEREYEVERCERYFLGQQSGAGKKKGGPTFNRFRATLRTQKPNLFYTNPKFFVRAKPGQSMGEETIAAVGEGVLEAIGTQDGNLKNAASLALWQSFFRVGVLKTCYDPKMEPNPKAGDPIPMMMGDQVMNDEAGNPVPMLDPLTNEIITEPDEVLTDEAYRYEYVDAKCMLLPDEGPDQSKWTWIGEEVTVDLEDAKQDSRFPQDLRNKLVSNTTERTDASKRNAKRAPEGDDKLKYCEVYDIRHKRLLIWADGQDFDEFLVYGPVPNGVEDHPYSLLVLGDPILGPDPSPWPVPYTYSWLDPQDEYNINRKQVQNAAKRAARKLYYDEGTFSTPDEMAKATSSDDLIFVKVNDIKNIPISPQESPLSVDVYKAVQMGDQDWRFITGTTGARAGVGDNGTATESTFTERAANLRDTDTQDAVNDWLSSAGRKMLQLVKDTLTIDMWIKLRGWSDSEFVKFLEKKTGMPGAQLMLIDQQFPGFKDMLKERIGKEKVQQITREDLTFEADVQVVPGSARPRNLENERAAWLEFLTLLGQFPQLGLSKELLKETAAKYDGMITERMVEEINALAMQMIQVNANQAGRSQGGNENGGGASSSTAGNPDQAAQMRGISGGAA